MCVFVCISHSLPAEISILPKMSRHSCIEPTINYEMFNNSVKNSSSKKQNKQTKQKTNHHLPTLFLFSPLCQYNNFFWPNRLEFEKKVPKCPLWLLSLKDPLFFALHTHGLFEGNVAPSNTVRSWKIVYSRNRIVQFGEYLQVQI